MSRTQQVSPAFRRIYQRLRTADLSASSCEDLSLEDLGLEMNAHRANLAFGTYSREGVVHALRAYGLVQRVEDRVGPLELRLSSEDPFHPRLTFWSRRFYAPVADLSLRRTTGAELGLTGTLGETEVLYLDSILLQHPGRHFDWTRPPLPGQSHPGLSLSKEILEILLLMATRIGAEALALTPSTFSAASVYERTFRFVDGAAQGRFSAMRRAGRQRPRWLLAWAVELGCLRDPQRQSALFTPLPMVAPLSRRMARRFESRSWREPYRQYADTLLAIDEEALQARFPWERMPPGPPPERVAELLGYDPLAPHPHRSESDAGRDAVARSGRST
ncbi:deacetylase [Citreicoccus inhibens]|uniref:deacetylase n=1 Tax=Citreicoccus inhibens TaxID=2849499 RepID=UPI001F1EB8DD|nr:deacetylase [Citreicoccus inhibens]